MSLKQRLNDWIKNEQGRIVFIDVIERQVREWGFKISNAERRLRPSDSPNIERVFKNGAIVGYRWMPRLSDLKEGQILQNSFLKNILVAPLKKK